MFSLQLLTHDLQAKESGDWVAKIEAKKKGKESDFCGMEKKHFAGFWFS